MQSVIYLFKLNDCTRQFLTIFKQKDLLLSVRVKRANLLKFSWMKRAARRTTLECEYPVNTVHLISTAGKTLLNNHIKLQLLSSIFGTIFLIIRRTDGGRTF